MVNINIEIPEDLHRQIKLEALMRGVTLKEHIVGKLDEGLRRRGR